MLKECYHFNNYFGTTNMIIEDPRYTPCRKLRSYICYRV